LLSLRLLKTSPADAAQHAVASVDREFDFLGSHVEYAFSRSSSRGAAVRRVSKYKAVAFGPLSTTLGACTLAGFTVITDEIAAQTWALHRLFHSPG
jgi:hypothetical protein